MDHSSPPARFTIAAPQLFDGTAMRGPAWVTISAGCIEKVGFDNAPSGETVELPAGSILAPGFIDLQVNGGGGVLLNDQPNEDGIRRIVEAHRRMGTTGCLPTLITDRADVIQQLATAAAAACQIPGVLGFHLEGPALNRARKGIHPESEIRLPDAEDLAAIRRIGRCGRSMVTLAPECVPPSMISDFLDNGLRVSAGHTEATAVQIAEAANHGLTGITHLFNAMSQLTPREPGVVGAALDDRRLFAGMICDGHHVDLVNLRLALRCKGPDRLMLVTDAMSLVGTEQRQFLLQGRQIELREGRLTGPDGTLAGAHLGMIEAVRNATLLLGAPLSEALIMASRTPATFLGLERELGSVAPAYRADLVAFNAEFEVIETWIGGRSHHAAGDR